MAKTIPTEQIISLYNKLAALSPKDSDRQRLIAHFANSFGVSHSTVRRQLRQHVPFGKTIRADKINLGAFHKKKCSFIVDSLRP